MSPTCVDQGVGIIWLRELRLTICPYRGSRVVLVVYAGGGGGIYLLRFAHLFQVSAIGSCNYSRVLRTYVRPIAPDDPKFARRVTLLVSI